jgi:DNA-binding transcriptional regulator YiaG
MSQQLYNFESPTLASEPSDTTIMILRERPSHHLLLVASGMLAIAGTSSAEPSRLWEKPYVHEFESTASSLGYQPLKTWNSDKNVSGESTGHAISEIRRISGLTWEQLGQLFGVSRRSVHFWASGKPLSSANEARLMQVLDIVREANRGYARNTRAALFQATDSIMPFDLLVSERFEEARELLGKQASHEIAHVDLPLTDEAADAAAEGADAAESEVVIDPYIVDFVCLEARLIVEADDGQHLELMWKMT